jgi:hypothetical protein
MQGLFFWAFCPHQFHSTKVFYTLQGFFLKNAIFFNLGRRGLYCNMRRGRICRNLWAQALPAGAAETF